MNKHILIYSIILLCTIISVNAQNRNDTIITAPTENNPLISEAELRAWHLIDSFKIAEQQEKEYKRLALMTNPFIYTKYLNLPITRLIDYNYYEGVRVGFGLMSNQNISKHFEVAGYFGYGFKDEDWKYGGDLILNLHEKTESKLHFSYMNDVNEKSGYHFLEKLDFTSTEIYRKYMIGKMDLIEKYQASFSLLILQHLRLNLYINQSHISTTDNYSFGSTLANSTNEFYFSEIGIQFRYAYKDPNLIYPIICGNITQGTNWFNGNYEYTKIETKISQTLQSKTLGKTKLTLVGGLADGNIPITKLYNGHESYQSFSFEAENSFGTMRFGEFYSDKFFSVFFKHDFGYLLKTDFFSPKLAVIHNYGIASLSNKKNHFDSESIKSYDKGYYEGGLLINNILHSSLIGYGFGIFYRYGPYDFDKTADNFAYKMSITFGL